ncbi:restriction endonuclease subunit S [Chitiniphilus shinanonensis]|uniref:restriction endonuclease subunit S n=1 Tax=Chitiniphilus shinanonensis TaxID=553088 RepID=UPI00305F3E68
MADQTKGKAPRIRFKAYGEPWADEKIGDVVAEKRRPIVLEDDQRYELITVKRRNEGVVSRGHLLGRDILVKNYAELKAGDFVISKRQVVHGATGIVPPSLDGAIVSNEYLTAVDSEKLLTEFLTIVASLPAMRRKFFLSSYGVDIEKLFFDADDWKKRTVTIPHVREQNRIGTFFRELDLFIALHQRKHANLKALKKAMLQKMFPKLDEGAPGIRFKGFQESWAEESVENAMENIANNSLSRANLNHRSGLAKNIHYGDILTIFGEVLDAQTDDVPLISSDAIVGKLSSTRLRDGDIVMADAAEDEAVGKCVELHNIGTQIVVAGLHTIALRPKNSFAPFFLGYYLNSDAFHTQLLPIMQGTKVLSISKSAIKRLRIRFPTDEVEQQRIGAYFYNLDLLIGQHARQAQKFRQIKVSFLDTMFL